MISRKAALVLAEVFNEAFTSRVRSRSPYVTGFTTQVQSDELYDFLYKNEYPAWLCNSSKKLHGERGVQEWVMKLHTGETQISATPNWSWDQRRRLGQTYLREFSEDILNWWRTEATDYVRRNLNDRIQKLVRALALDGYIYSDDKLLIPESDVLDAQEEQGVLQSLYDKLHLGNRETAFHHLALSEEHYHNAKWDDSISNSRKYLEAVLQEVAALHHQTTHGTKLPESTFTRPVAVRDYLEREGLLDNKEKEALAKVYGLLSHTGGHPYMAESDQARLLRYLSLTFSQFVMLRLEGNLRPQTSEN